MPQLEKRFLEEDEDYQVSLYDKRILYGILRIIRDNQDFLYENRDQAAKIGYIFEKIHSVGRCSELGCDDNPKYDLCDYIDFTSEEVENVIYDSWGMHVSNDISVFDYDEFVKLIFEGKELSDFQKKFRKENKTFDEWVEILTDSQYEYSYKDRKRVADHLLCVIGNGYGLSEDGFVYEEASGADQDKGSYGMWENAEFKGDILKSVQELISNGILKEAFNKAEKHVKKLREEDEKRNARYNLFKKLSKVIDTDKEEGTRNELQEDGMTKGEIDDLFLSVTNVFGGSENKNRPYYPICNYSIIHKIMSKGKKAHPSYMKECIDVCKDILYNKENEEKENIEFAERMLNKHVPEYIN